MAQPLMTEASSLGSASISHRRSTFEGCRSAALESRRRGVASSRSSDHQRFSFWAARTYTRVPIPRILSSNRPHDDVLFFLSVSFSQNYDHPHRQRSRLADSLNTLCGDARLFVLLQQIVVSANH
jgi:hypothetical protein